MDRLATERTGIGQTETLLAAVRPPRLVGGLTWNWSPSSSGTGTVFATAFEDRLGISLVDYEDQFFYLMRDFLD